MHVAIERDRSAFKGLIFESLDQLLAAEFIRWIFRVVAHLQDIKVSRPSNGMQDEYICSNQFQSNGEEDHDPGGARANRY